MTTTTRAAARVSKRLARHVPDSWTARNALRKRLNSADRVHFDDAIGQLILAGLVESQDVEYHSQYGIAYRRVPRRTSA